MTFGRCQLRMRKARIHAHVTNQVLVDFCKRGDLEKNKLQPNESVSNCFLDDGGFSWSANYYKGVKSIMVVSFNTHLWIIPNDSNFNVVIEGITR